MKSLVLRFDIDTYRCINEGVPRLLQLAREEQVNFVFFCNMGRAISRLALLGRLLHRESSTATGNTARKLTASIKLGRYEMFRTLLFNPLVGMSRPKPLQQAHAEGHDLGLHGGRNHGAWQYGFRNWKENRIRSEVAAGKAMFERSVRHPPTLFSSPGWQGSALLNSILKEMGFKASADRHGPRESDAICEDGFCTLPTNMVSEPGGVAYFESRAARGYDGRDLVQEFQASLQDNRRLYVLYDHPCYAGVRALDSVRAVLRCAMENGVAITTYSALIPQ